MKIAVTSAYSRSRHAIGLVTLLHRAGHQVGLCLNVRLLSVRRFLVYFRQYGPRLFQIVRRRALAGSAGALLDPEVRYIDAFLRERGVVHQTLREACREARARLLSAPDLNAPAALEALDEFRPDLVVYAGGGILRKEFLERPAIGTLNAHGGPLPAIRGMNAAEWALFHGKQPGTTVHFMDAGVDTGPILFFRPQPVGRGETIGEIRGRAVVGAVTALLEAVGRIAAGDYQSTPQDPAAGRQYFAMHPLLVDIVQDWVREGLTPLAHGARSPA